MEKRRRATVRNKKQRGPISLEEKHENFIEAVRNEKREMQAAIKQGENELQWKEKTVNRNTYNISSIKRVTRTFLENSRRRSCETSSKKCRKKCAARALLFFAN